MDSLGRGQTVYKSISHLNKSQEAWKPSVRIQELGSFKAEVWKPRQVTGS